MEESPDLILIGTGSEVVFCMISMTQFTMSGPGGALFSTFGFSPENIVAKGKTVVEYYNKASSVPNLMSRPTFDDAMIAHGH
jgi:transketolase